ncbi:glutathione transferase GstA [Aestuariispira ectoiniformans]|uniref:glutathione transferase GstA n=1 Tax=Aestuariispira ectoiniformans TaxID=2775080 RepID=UPI00223BF22E|nr:glutathione transferase GstA [Aestuariispira ectoiniformans]
MKLYYSPGACSLASHIVLQELGTDFTIEKVDNKAKVTESGENFLEVNPKGYVPALRLDSDIVLTEGAAILQYLADQHPEKGLAPKPGTLERTHLQAHLNFVASELHKAFSPLFKPDTSDADRDTAKANVARRLDTFEADLKDGRDYLGGDQFSVADSYLFVVVNWSGMHGIDVSQWPHIAAFQARVAARPAVQAALKAEGLI